MNIKYSDINFERGELVSAARLYFTVKDMSSGVMEKQLIAHEFRRLLGNITGMHSSSIAVDELDLVFIAQVVMVAAVGHTMSD